MAHQKTAVAATDMFLGNKAYQLHARRALPLLVRQALTQSPIYYGRLAQELGVENPRNMNFILGSVGTTLERLGQKWGSPIPPIQSLAIAQGSNLPGKGFFEGFTNLQSPTRQQREAALKKYLGEIFAYPNWLQVLRELQLSPVQQPEAAEAVELARQMQGGGEGEAHRRLKDRIYEQPSLIGVSSAPKFRVREYLLPSADRLDVYFEYKREQIAVEVKPSTSGNDDIARGIFQCVKYEAVLRK